MYDSTQAFVEGSTRSSPPPEPRTRPRPAASRRLKATTATYKASTAKPVVPAAINGAAAVTAAVGFAVKNLVAQTIAGSSLVTATVLDATKNLSTGIVHGLSTVNAQLDRTPIRLFPDGANGRSTVTGTLTIAGMAGLQPATVNGSSLVSARMNFKRVTGLRDHQRLQHAGGRPPNEPAPGRASDDPQLQLDDGCVDRQPWVQVPDDQAAAVPARRLIWGWGTTRRSTCPSAGNPQGVLRSPGGCETVLRPYGNRAVNDQMWIVIPGWDKFQHYSDREMRWIKCYTSLLSKPEYMRLTLPQRGLLHGLWLLYAESHRAIPLDTAYISRTINGRATNAQLESLRDAGLIEFSASKPLAQSREEKKREEKKDLRAIKKPIAEQPQLPLAVKEKKPRAPDPIWDVLGELFGEALTGSERTNRGKTVAELKQAGATVDEIRSRTQQMWKLGWDSPSENALRNRWTMLGLNGKHPGDETTAERMLRLRDQGVLQ